MTPLGAAHDHFAHPGAVAAVLDGPTITRLSRAAEQRGQTIHDLAAEIITDWTQETPR